MPPDISAGLSSTAGLIAQAAAPPGTAVSAGPGLPNPLSASLFAAFLAQSTPPSLSAVLGTETKPPLPISVKTILATHLKTMDTLPTLSFPLAPKAKDKASELLLSPVPLPAHHAPADTPVNALPPAVPSQPAFISPVPSLVTSLAPLTSAPLTSAPTVATLLPASALVTPVPALVTSAPALVTPVPASLTLAQWVTPGAPVLTRPEAAAAAGLSLSRTFALLPSSPLSSLVVPALLETPAMLPQALAPAVPALLAAALVSQDSAPRPILMQTLTLPAPAVDALPRLANPAPSAPQEPSLQVRARIQEQAAPSQPAPSSQSPPLTPALTAPAAVLTQAAGQSGVAPPTFSPSPESPKPVPAKTAGKTSPAALKSTAGNADTSTRILQGQTEVVSAKTAPSALTLPLVEKHAPEHETPPVTDDGSRNSQFTLPATVTDAANVANSAQADAKPLSARERAEVIKQAAGGVGAMPLPAKLGATEQMSVQLHPKDWGRLEVSVTVVPSQESGAAKTVTAHIVAETPLVKAALQSGTGALHEALRASGLHLEHLTVSVKLPESSVPDMKPAVQSAPAGPGSSSGPGSNANPGTHSSPGSGFGTGQWQNNRQPPPVYAVPVLNEPEIEDVPLAKPALRALFGRVDTHA